MSDNNNNKPKDRHKGSVFTVIHCEGALESYIEALNSVNAGRRKSFTRRIIQQLLSKVTKSSIYIPMKRVFPT